MVELIVALVVAFVVLVALARTVRIVPQARAGVVERLGRYSARSARDSTIVVPFVDRIRQHDRPPRAGRLVRSRSR